MVSIKTLENTKIEAILHAFNLAFSDYMIPMQITQEQLESKIRMENIKLEYSVGAFENNELIAFILHGHDVVNGKQLLYNGGTGVIPAKRGNNLTLKLYDFIRPVLRKAGISTVTLEVITTNIPAVSTYKKVGFVIVRELQCYKGLLTPQNTPEYEVRLLAELDWKKLTSFWDWIPTWQNNISAIENSKTDYIKIGVFDNKDLTAYMIFNPKNYRILQFAVDKTRRNKGIGTQLFGYISTNYTSEVSLINIESSAISTNSFLADLGLKKSISQYEMVLSL